MTDKTEDGTIEISLDDLTSDELLDVEDATGKTTSQLFPEGGPSYRGVLALYWVARRRQEPGFSWDDAKKTQVRGVMQGVRLSSNGQSESSAQNVGR